ncbi:hypothetical protein TC41_2913 [Alicyclobacillus acidocaldarius subsp. acidocaldarius Tc-4-1]|uniref:Uncharacterized protein n=1 Tax=Alicyclobacillus acidocaldarius (strain Tc-4-1) TaxID=1048834 RepID=F8IKN9_ALIAT|nr:hypothetical protein TC41_2913 [Alicyclobacillus acidocaldarius subsp. acidocaldarius Tc-4-1]
MGVAVIRSPVSNRAGEIGSLLSKAGGEIGSFFEYRAAPRGMAAPSFAAALRARA